MQPGEQPLLAIPAIWDNGQGPSSTPCDVIVTNQRLMGYYSSTMPRKRLFLEAFDLSTITTISLRQKTFEPIFRELLVSDGQRRVYIRSRRRYIEALFAAVREAIEAYVPSTQTTFADEQQRPAEETARSAPVYGRQDIRTSFEHSPLAITLLFVGGLAIEVVGIVLWSLTGSAQVGAPLFIAGLLAVLTAMFSRRKR